MNKALLYVSTGLLLLACASGERKVDNLTVAPSASDNPADELALLDKELTTAREQNVPVLSPTWYRSAEHSCDRARTARENGRSQETIFTEIAQCRAQIERAKEAAKVSQKVLGEVLEQRKTAWAGYHAAEAAGATGLKEVSEGLMDADEHLSDLAVAVEDNNAEKAAKEKNDVIAEYRHMQARALQKEKLDVAQRVIDQAKDEGAKKYAPKTLAYSEEVMSSAEKFIENTPVTSAELDKKAKEVLFYSNRALEMTRESKKLAAAEPEDRALWVEANIQQLGTLMAQQICETNRSISSFWLFVLEPSLEI